MESIKVHGERAELVAVCDTDPAKHAAAVARTGARGTGRRNLPPPTLDRLLGRRRLSLEPFHFDRNHEWGFRRGPEL
jgi:hypothetical protein